MKFEISRELWCYDMHDICIYVRIYLYVKIKSNID